MMKNKPFDCVEMKHQAAAHVQAELAGMTDQEKIAYFQRIGEEYRVQQAARRTRHNTNTRQTGTNN